jgi:hypothetical protein
VSAAINRAKPITDMRRRRDVPFRALLSVILIGLATSGCVGGASGGGATHIESVAHMPADSVLVTVPIGLPARSRHEVHAVCPQTATCRIVRVPNIRPTYWAAVVSRRLTCSPDGGDYADPVAACRALDLLILPPQSSVVCGCPIAFRPASTIVGRVRGHAFRREYGVCDMCGAAPPLRDALNTLLTP